MPGQTAALFKASGLEIVRLVFKDPDYPMSRFCYVLLGWCLSCPAGAAERPLRLPVDGRWREFVHVPGGNDSWWTLYLPGSAQVASKAQQLRNRIALKLNDANKAAEIARDYGLAALGHAKGTEVN